MSAQKKVYLEREKAKEMAAKAAEQQDTARKTREAKVKARQDHLDDLDALIDEIDEMLEEQEVLTSYRQRGGQKWPGLIKCEDGIRETCSLRRSRSTPQRGLMDSRPGHWTNLG